ncbi:MAG: ParA family protein [Gallionella sp.]|nr:ParA family protein [Gallionella sp.]
MGIVIGIIQVKGGVGRSTLATNLAAALARSARVALIDADVPQGTSASWGALRKRDGLLGQLTVASVADHRALVSKVRELVELNDFVVIDGPPRLAEVTRAIMAMSRLCLIPLGASVAEIWATADLVGIIQEARDRHLNVNARIVWNRFRQQTRAAHELGDAAEKQLGLFALQHKLGYRVAYSEVLARGLTVAEWPDHLARDEFAGLVFEIKQLLGVSVEMEK